MIKFPRHVTHPTVVDLRRYGLVLGTALLLLTLVAVIRQGVDTPWVGYLTPLAALAATLGLLVPGILALPYKVWCGAGYLVSVAVSWAAVALLFWCVITPLGLLFRLRRRDVLQRRRRDGVASYWQPAGKVVGIRSYFRQY